MIAAGQINPVRAGYWEDEMHLRFKAPPLSPQVISCHNVPRERDRADSHWKLCKDNAAGRRGPSSCSAPRCSWVDWAHPQASRLLCLSNLQFTTAKHKAARANSCEPTAVQRCHQQCFTAAQRQQLGCTLVKARLTVPIPANTNAQCFTWESISKEIAVHWCSK